MATAVLPTLYEYYNGGATDHPVAGLSANSPTFTLNNRNVSLYSGALHYFRIPRKYWRDRLRKLRAAGLNTVETYIPWNLHQPEEGVYDFGNGTHDMSDLLHLKEFLETAKEEDLLAVVRPGPYICAEWEWGGLPSWLLSKSGVEVRTSEPTFVKYVKQYFAVLLPILAALQFTRGGPIVAFQVENEYASSPSIHPEYLKELYNLFKQHGIVELLVSSDSSGNAYEGSIKDLLLPTRNFGSNPKYHLDKLRKLLPDKPLMVMEFWTGWFDHWGEKHHVVRNQTFEDIYETIVKYPSSVNMYMFHGGTNFGFLNGANFEDGDYKPTTSSYDYDAPLSENGDYTSKYHIVKKILEKYDTVKTRLPQAPKLIPRKVYRSLPLRQQLNLMQLLQSVAGTSGTVLKSMEEIGQSYGYIVYELNNVNLKPNSTLTIVGTIHDTMMVVLNDELITKPLVSRKDFDGFGYWRHANSSMVLTNLALENARLYLIVENWGRVNFGNINNEKKGLSSRNRIVIDGTVVENFQIKSLDFRKSWTKTLTNWSTRTEAVQKVPTLYKALLFLSSEPKSDTYIDTRGWIKGVVIVNGFVLGRYSILGPQHSLYLPAPFLKKGDNEILIFEHFKREDLVKFVKDPIFKRG